MIQCSPLSGERRSSDGENTVQLAVLFFRNSASTCYAAGSRLLSQSSITKEIRKLSIPWFLFQRLHPALCNPTALHVEPFLPGFPHGKGFSGKRTV
jgi:hypothetical protein